MKRLNKKLMVGLAAMLLSAPSVAQSDESVILNGGIIRWYAYGVDPTQPDRGQGWFQMGPGLGTPERPYNYGIGSPLVDPQATDGRPVRMLEFPLANHLCFANAGGVYTGDAFYCFYQHEVGWEDNMDGEMGSESWEILVRKFNLETGTYTVVGRSRYQPTDLCYDPLYDRVYGIFYISSGDETGYKLCTIDMQTLDITPISRTAMAIGAEMRCLAINSKGELYGIDASGNVARISSEDGAITYIGNVGFRTQRDMMSATFDLRTDKLYWVGFCNNGKVEGATGAGTNETLSVAEGGKDTGVYIIDTETGNATLVGKTNFVDVSYTYDDNGTITGATTAQYGKLQMTGLYVVDSFTKKNVDQKIELVSAPSQLVVGQQTEFVVNVKNIGLSSIGEDDWKVVFYINDTEVGSKSGRDLEPGESRQVKLAYTAPDRAGQLRLRAEVVNANDEESRNNATELKTIVVLNSRLLPSVELAAIQQGNGLTLQWADPNGHIVDGAEDYVPFTYDALASWTTYDGDKGYTQRPSSYNLAVDYANWNTPKAYIVFNPEEAGLYLTGSAKQFEPFAGKQYFASFFTAITDDSEAGGHAIDRDDWLISPRLAGTAQTISFAAKGYKGSVSAGYETEANYTERILVCYSDADDNAVEHFQAVGDTIEVNAEEWQVYEVGLPDGANYFAIRCVSRADEGFVMMLDNITFRGEPLTVTGYRVYKNGELLTTLTADKTSYTLRSAAESDIFNVTAVYDEGESPYSNDMSIAALLGIDSTPVVETRSADGLYNLKGQPVSRLSQPGLYIVRQGNQVRKIIVK